jgi:hypothetical protein
MKDLTQAIMAKEQAVASNADDHAEHSSLLNNLGCALKIKFVETGSVETLDRAIMMEEQAVASTTDD